MPLVWPFLGLDAFSAARAGALVVVAAAILGAPAGAQTIQSPAPRVVSAARPEDVRTIGGIVRAFYATVSGPAGQPRQWRRDSTLYLPSHRFIATGGRATDRGGAIHVMDHATFAAITDSLLTPGGFYEREIKRVTLRFGAIATVLSTYESRRTATGPVTDRGVNSLQLVWDGARWWIASTAWDTEREGQPIPRSLLP